MAFTREVARTPVSIRDIGIELTDLLQADDTHDYAARFSVQVVMSDGSIQVRQGNLLPHITTAQRNGLLSFMQSLQTQVETELLP